MDNYIYLICKGDEPPCAAVLTEADAEELYMDLVLQVQYENFLWELQEGHRTPKECMQCEWITETCGGYYITRAPKLY